MQKSWKEIDEVLYLKITFCTRNYLNKTYQLLLQQFLILVLISLKSSLLKNIISQASKKILSLWQRLPCLFGFKIVKHNRYNNLHSLPILIHCWKDFSRDFITKLAILANKKDNNQYTTALSTYLLVTKTHLLPLSLSHYSATSLALIKKLSTGFYS